MKLNEIVSQKPIITVIDVKKTYGSVYGYILKNADKTVIPLYNWAETEHIPHKVIDNVFTDYIKNNNQTCDSIAILKNINSKKRNKGAGTKLLDAFIEKAQDEYVKIIFLIADNNETQLDGFNLQKWYEQYGFVKIADCISGPLMICSEI